MSFLVGLHHVTGYRYDRPVSLGPQIIRLRPAPHSRTAIKSYSLKVLPANHFVNWQQDPHGNWIARYVFPEKTTEFAIAVDFVADMQVINPFDFFVEPYADIFPFEYPEALRTDLAAFLEPEPAGPLLQDFMRTLSREPMNTVNYLVALNQKLQTLVRYVTRMEPGVQTPDETLQAGSGSCRDSAWLLVQIVRQLGMPARFVSGYLIQLKPDLKPLDGPAGATQDFTDLHAWTEVYIPGAGWIGFDPTSGLLCGEGHLPVAATPHSSLGGADHRRGRRRGGRLFPRDAGQPHRRETAGHLSVFRRGMDPRSMRSATRSMPTSRPRTSVSPWAASRPSSPSTTTSRRSGTPTRSAPPSASAPTN